MAEQESPLQCTWKKVMTDGGTTAQEAKAGMELKMRKMGVDCFNCSKPTSCKLFTPAQNENKPLENNVK